MEPVSPTAKEALPPGVDRIVSKLPMDDPEFREIVDEFVGRLQQQINAMQTAWESRDLKQIAEIAHWPKNWRTA